MGTNRAIATNTILMVIGKVLTTIFMVVLTAILARTLGVYGFGEFTTATAYIGLFGVFADFGFFQILIRELARNSKNESSIASSILLLRSLLAIVVYGIAAGLVWLFPYSTSVSQSAGILALAGLAITLNSSLIAIFQARLQMIKAVVGDVLSRAALLGGVIWTISLGWDLPEIFLVFLLANLLNLLISLGYAGRLIPLTFKFDLPYWQQFLRSSWPLGVTAILSTLYFKGDMVILSIYKTPTDVGIYSAAYKIFEVLIVLPSILMGNVLPSLTRSVTSGSQNLERLVQTIFDILAVGGIGASFALLGLSSQIINLVVGPEFLTASTVRVGSVAITAPLILMILSVGLIFIFIANLWSYLIIAQDGQRQLIKPGILATILNFSLNLIFIPQIGYLAAALSTVVTEAYIVWAWGRLASPTLRQPINWGVPIRAFGAGVGMLAALWLGRYLNLGILIVLGTLVYSGLLWLLGARSVFLVMRQLVQNN